MGAMKKNVVRVGMCDVSKKRAKHITKTKKESLDIVNDDSATEDDAEFVVEHVLEDVDEEDGDVLLANTTNNFDQPDEDDGAEEEDFDENNADVVDLLE